MLLFWSTSVSVGLSNVSLEGCVDGVFNWISTSVGVAMAWEDWKKLKENEKFYFINLDLGTDKNLVLKSIQVPQPLMPKTQKQL